MLSNQFEVWGMVCVYLLAHNSHLHLLLLCLSFPSTVVYEGCPKAFDAGIWWPKTQFGRPAAMNCPKGSIGECFLYPSDDKSNMWSNYLALGEV